MCKHGTTWEIIGHNWSVWLQVGPNGANCVQLGNSPFIPAQLGNPTFFQARAELSLDILDPFKPEQSQALI